MLVCIGIPSNIQDYIHKLFGDEFTTISFCDFFDLDLSLSARLRLESKYKYSIIIHESCALGIELSIYFPEKRDCWILRSISSMVSLGVVDASAGILVERVYENNCNSDLIVESDLTQPDRVFSCLGKSKTWDYGALSWLEDSTETIKESSHSVIAISALGAGIQEWSKSDLVEYVRCFVKNAYRGIIDGSAKIFLHRSIVDYLGISISNSIGIEFSLYDFLTEELTSSRSLFTDDRFVAYVSTLAGTQNVLLFNKRIRIPVDQAQQILKRYIRPVSLERVAQGELAYKRQTPIPYPEKSGSKLVTSWFQEPIVDEGTEDAFIAYIPWIKEHTNALIDIIRSHYRDLPLVPLRLMKDPDNRSQRTQANLLAFENPTLFRKLVISSLLRAKPHIKAIIVTFDWNPFMRLVVESAKSLSIKTILIPHEGVFANQDLYYTCNKSLGFVPSTDFCMAWGPMQKRIWMERGYPGSRITITGSPKLDLITTTVKEVSRSDFYNAYSLSARLKTILIVVQPLDCQYEQKAALESQRQAIMDIIEYTQEGVEDGYPQYKANVLIRMPPSKALDPIQAIRKEIGRHANVRIDENNCYILDAQECIRMSDVVVSVNSTMLFEAALLRKQAISIGYISGTCFWNNIGIPSPENKSKLTQLIDSSLLRSNLKYNLEWAEDNLAPSNNFDGKATARVAETLREIISQDYSRLDKSHDFVIGQKVRGFNFAMPHPPERNSTQVHLKEILRVDSFGTPTNDREAHCYDFFGLWGIKDTPSKARLKELARAQGKGIIYIEDAFIRSCGLGLHGDPCLGVILDDITPYYNTREESRLERILSSALIFNEEELSRASMIMQDIRENRISKYNHAPYRELKGLRSSEKAILLVDQRYGDASLRCGFSSDQTFREMLANAEKLVDTHDVFVKIHPDATDGGKESCLLRLLEEFPGLIGSNNFKLVDFAVNPYSLFEIVDEVWVSTSGLGFEACIAGIKTRCFAQPFYAGWGFTDDSNYKERAHRSVTEVFYVAYLLLSRYVNPNTQRAGELEDVIGYIKRNSIGSFSGDSVA